jgi:hypothetical protein
MQQYCDEHGNDEMENIRRTLEVQHSKELQMKKALESASDAFKSYKHTLLEKRKEIHRQAQH